MLIIHPSHHLLPLRAPQFIALVDHIYDSRFCWNQFMLVIVVFTRKSGNSSTRLGQTSFFSPIPACSFPPVQRFHLFITTWWFPPACFGLRSSSNLRQTRKSFSAVKWSFSVLPSMALMCAFKVSSQFVSGWNTVQGSHSESANCPTIRAVLHFITFFKNSHYSSC